MVRLYDGGMEPLPPDVVHETISDILGVFIVTNAASYRFVNAPITTNEKSCWEVAIIESPGPCPETTVPSPHIFVLDTLYSEAFGHWVFESAVYLQSFHALKAVHPGVKLQCNCPKRFKTLFLDYFGIAAEDVMYNEAYDCDRPDNTCKAGSTYIFPVPMTSVSERLITERYKVAVTALFRAFQDLPGEQVLEGLIMPRGTVENFASNDRSQPLLTVLEAAQGRVAAGTWAVLHTDTITDVRDQVTAVRSAGSVVLTDGSSMFVNGMFARGQTLYVLGNVTPWQVNHFVKLAFIQNCIERMNGNTVVHTDEAEVVRSLLWMEK